MYMPSVFVFAILNYGFIIYSFVDISSFHFILINILQVFVSEDKSDLNIWIVFLPLS